MGRRSRRTAGGSIPEPVDLNHLILTSLVTTLDNGTQFLLYDSGPDRVFLFSNEKNIELLSRCSIFFLYGTFLTAPANLFCQLYTVHEEISAGGEKMLFS